MSVRGGVARADEPEAGAESGPRREAPPELSVVVPLRDESGSLEALHRELDAALAGLAGGVELLFVDDGSRDESGERLRELARKDPRVRVLRFPRSRGQSAALDAGFRAARAPWIATLDADLQNDPADLPALLARRDGYDAVCGVRVGRRDDWVRRVSSRVANAVRNRVLGEQVSDVGCSLRVMRADLLRRIRLYRGLHRFLPALLRLEGARLLEVPVGHRPRRFGRSKYGVGNRLGPALLDLLVVRWMQSRHPGPPPDEEPPGDGRRGRRGPPAAERR